MIGPSLASIQAAMHGDISIDKAVQWKSKPQLVSNLLRVTQATNINSNRGKVLPTTSDVRVLPTTGVDPSAKQILLASPAISVVGSFAPNVLSAAMSVLALQNQFTIYFDGTNGSKQIKLRRADGFSVTLPKGWLNVSGLTPGVPGGAAPAYDLLPYYIPGACNVSWVAGVTGSPAFCWPTGTVDADSFLAQRRQGREALTDGPITVTLQPVPAPPPTPVLPPPGPGFPVGNSTYNGTLTLTVDAPQASAVEDLSFAIQAHATDTAYQVMGWQVVLDGKPPMFKTPGPATQINVPATLENGVHTLQVTCWDALGTECQVNIAFTVQQQNVNPNPPPPPPPPVPTPPGGGCVMLGTPIDIIGDSPHSFEQLPQHEWVRIYTDRGRELIATPDHPVYTSRAGRTEMRDVHKGDMVITMSGEEKVTEKYPDPRQGEHYVRPGFKVKVNMQYGHLFWANGFLSHNVKFHGAMTA